jgi:hypothetical protein
MKRRIGIKAVCATGSRIFLYYDCGGKRAEPKHNQRNYLCGCKFKNSGSFTIGGMTFIAGQSVVSLDQRKSEKGVRAGTTE